VPCKLPVCCLLPSAINQTLNVHCQASQPYWYTGADVRAIARFISALVSFDQHAVDLALIKQARSGPRPTKCENRLAFHCQLEETCTHRTANAECKDAHKKSLTTHFKVFLANCLAPAVSISAMPIAPKLILIDFKKIQGKDCVKIF
jgi:hypothetical protein